MASKSSFDAEAGMTTRRDATRARLAVALEDEESSRVESKANRTEPNRTEPNERECLVSINIIHASGYE